MRAQHAGSVLLSIVGWVATGVATVLVGDTVGDHMESSPPDDCYLLSVPFRFRFVFVSFSVTFSFSLRSRFI